MNTLKPVRLKHAWQGWPEGHVFTAMPAVQADHMIAAGQAEYVTKDMPSPADRMMRSEQQVHRGRGRSNRSQGML